MSTLPSCSCQICDDAQKLTSLSNVYTLLLTLNENAENTDEQLNFLTNLFDSLFKCFQKYCPTCGGVPSDLFTSFSSLSLQFIQSYLKTVSTESIQLRILSTYLRSVLKLAHALPESKEKEELLSCLNKIVRCFICI